MELQANRFLSTRTSFDLATPRARAESFWNSLWLDVYLSLEMHAVC